jgi:PPK2 family polyphosphate:nucleotide phosphotransferase
MITATNSTRTQVASKARSRKQAEAGDGYEKSVKYDDPTAAFKAAMRQMKEATAQLAEKVDISRKDYRVDSKTRLKDIDPGDYKGLPKDDDVVKALTSKELDRIDKLQNKLYAEHKHKVLIVFQAMDTGGKDGSIKSLTRGMNPQGVKVACFKAPTEAERDHDPLWRVHQHVPGKGEIAIFNRSHYEDVLVTRVHNYIDDQQAENRLEHIRNFEKMQGEEGTTIIKFFLHIDKDEQKARLQARQDDPEKNWKLCAADIEERKYWDDYQKVYQETMRETSTKDAPWYVVPANDKPRRDLILATIVRKTLEDLEIQAPKASPDVSKLVIK